MRYFNRNGRMPDNLILISVLAKPSPTHARKTLIADITLRHSKPV
ncbi:hypothetical protein NEICINOT_04417 [Neisseria cinerea ATCC 14685]|uniref:Uncharacterized protein n=1 Tax=Neisseria cinerea ATCC 14685 TaxID=546262 RepID=D0W425_NEICI|nr:hypothetical protein NEICINOT_04417 [Neisseria cinerea ATCC 14685]